MHFKCIEGKKRCWKTSREMNRQMEEHGRTQLCSIRLCCIRYRFKLYVAGYAPISGLEFTCLFGSLSSGPFRSKSMTSERCVRFPSHSATPPAPSPSRRSSPSLCLARWRSLPPPPLPWFPVTDALPLRHYPSPARPPRPSLRRPPSLSLNFAPPTTIVASLCAT